MKLKINYRLSLIYAGVILLAVFLLALMVRPLANYFDRLIIRSVEPAVTLEQAEPVATEILFNNQLGTTIFAEAIIPLIDQAQTSLEIAMYGFSYPEITEAIFRASQRGVKVILILDKQHKISHDQVLASMPPEIKRLDLGADSDERGNLMHHKFALIDRGQPGQTIIFGSFNWTYLQERYDPSFLIISQSSTLIASFGREFDRLSLGWSGRDKLTIKNYQPWDLELGVGNNNYEVWFSPGWPGNNLNQRLFALIQTAQKDIKIMTWDFTDDNLARELVAKAQAGVKVTVLTDTWNFYNENSVFTDLLAAKERLGLDNLLVLNDLARDQEMLALGSFEESLDREIDPFFHYHVLMIDDQQVAFGTNNLSRNAAYFNDEAMMVSDDPVIIDEFLKSFWKNYQINLSIY